MPQSGLPRNIQIYDSSGHTPILVAGLMQLGRTTTQTLYACLEICFLQPPPSQFQLCDTCGTVLSRANPDRIVPINHYIVTSQTFPEGRQERPGYAYCPVAYTESAAQFLQGTCPRSGSEWSSAQLYSYLDPRNPAADEGALRIDSVQNGILLDWTYQVTFFVQDYFQQHDGQVVQFNSSAELPAPPRELLYEHFKQAVLANMKGAGLPRDLDDDETYDAQSMSVFDDNRGRKQFEILMADKLAHLQDESVDGETVIDG